MTRRFFTADPHYGHERVIEHCDRPFADVQEMNDALVERWNAVVRPIDEVWVLGDVTLSTQHLHHVGRLNGRKILVAGNHDSCWTGHKRTARARRQLPTYLAYFELIYASGLYSGLTVAGKPVNVSHLPYAGDHGENDRYADRRPVDDGRVLLCGHVHEKWTIRARQINVGVDRWDFTPVGEEQLEPLVHGLYSQPRPTTVLVG